MQKNKRGFTAINGGGGNQEREQERARERNNVHLSKIIGTWHMA